MTQHMETPHLINFFKGKAPLGFIILCLLGTILITKEQGWFIQKFLPTKTVKSTEVSLTPNGFSPKKIMVEVGTTVTFYNKTANSFWPASNFHPAHTLYSDFDPKKPIAPGNSWSFTFEKAGTWEYHDHLAPYFDGEVMVGTLSQKKKEETQCTESRQPKECWRKILLHTLGQKGLQETLLEVSDLYRTEPLFSDQCHGLTHDIGLRSYDLYLKNPTSILSPRAAFCANGFYHGFMEAFLTASRDLQKSKDFCSFIGKNLGTEAPDAELQCYHGIGHGALELGLSADISPTGKFSEQSLLDPALTICKKISTSPEQLYRCASGAFNGVANFYLQEEFGLIPRADDPLWICRSYPDHFKESCYGNMNALISGIVKHDFSRAVQYIENIEEDGYAISSMRYLSNSPVTTKVRTDPEKAIEVCRNVQKRLYGACIEGLSHSFLEHGQPEEEGREALSFCGQKKLNFSEKELCFRYVLANLKGWFSPEKVRQICMEAKPEYQHYCKASEASN